jgi:DNA-binding transcriptional LysR family regulator
MDRIDVMKVFVGALDEGSLAGAGRRLGRSPAAVSRAIAFLEAHVGAALLHRTTRSIRLSEAGERYAVACRRVLIDLEEAGHRCRRRAFGAARAADHHRAGRGRRGYRAPDRRCLHGRVSRRECPALFPGPSANLIDEGIDLALRIAHLADSTLIAVRVGEVRRVVAASPRYLDQHPVIAEPADLAKHQIVAMTHFGIDSWSFPPQKGSTVPRAVQFTPRLIVNSI